LSNRCAAQDEIKEKYSVATMRQGKALVAVALATASQIALAQTTVAGFTPGSFRVTEGGAGEYRIPIRVPPGIAGMEPRLALAYNSQVGNGLAGVGWNLEGLSAVTRCARTMAQDGVRGGVNYDANDRYCLDGQRLIAVSGSYGADGTEYRTERESFSKVASYGTAGNGPAWFKVWTKAGQILEYGNTADSRLEAQGKSSVRVWAISKTADTKGNYFTVTYTEDSTNGEHYPSRIDYSASATAPASNSVRFVLEARTDSPSLYAGGSLVKRIQRLAKVQSFLGETLVREYRLTYEMSPGTSRSRVTAIQECDAGNACIAPVTFAWAAGATGFGSRTSTENGGNWPVGNYKRHALDVNGDGKADLLLIADDEAVVYTYLADGLGSFASSAVVTDLNGNGWSASAYPRRFADVNGDGRVDLVLILEGEAQAHVFLGTESGAFVAAPVHTDVGGNGWTASFYPRYLHDVNGDGRADLVLMRDDEAVVYAFLANGDGSFSQTPVVSDLEGNGWTASAYPRRFGDANGDGIVDIILILTSEAEAHVFLGNGDGSFTTRVITDVNGSGYSAYFTRYLEDVNGDGIVDFILIADEEVEVIVFLGKGDGSFVSAPLASDINGSGWSASAYPRRFADVNGDGMKDLVLLLEHESDGHAFLSRGDGSFSLAPISVASPSTGWTQEGYRRFVDDFTGDGKSEMMLVHTVEVAAHVWKMATPIDAITAFTDSLGAAVTVVYKPMTDSSVYTKDATAAYPVLDLKVPSPLVASHSRSNGAGGQIVVSSLYGGAKSSHDGRGYLGFRWVESTDVATGLKLRSEHRQDWPFVGMPSVVRKTQSSGAVLSEATSTHSCTDPASGAACAVVAGNRYFPFVSQSVETGSDLNGAALPTVTTATQYDSYGNPTSVALSTGDGYSKTTTNTFLNDSVNWLIGRLTRSTAQSTSP
jgi:hypothetical protein